MTNCTRSRKLPAQPIRQIISDLRSDQASSRETAYIAAQEAAAAFKQSVAAILSTFTFSRYEYGTLYNAAGECTQAAMQIVSPTDVNDRYLVIAKNGAEFAEYEAYCPPFHQDRAGLMIAAVKARIENNRAERLRQAAQAATLSAVTVRAQRNRAAHLQAAQAA
jgi:hypothetical protein